MPETFHWIEGGALGRLAATLHVPEGAGPHPAVLFCHGFTGNRVEPQRLFLSYARRLASRGLAVLRFDFGGHGDSEGAFHDLTLAGELKDAQAAWDFLGSHPTVDGSRRALLGFSLGGWVAASTAPRLHPRALALWAPVDDPIRMKVRFLGLHGEEKLLAGEDVDIMGEKLGAGFAQGFEKPTGLAPGDGYGGPVLILQGTADASLSLQSSENYEKAFRERGVETRRVILQGAKHLFETAAHRETLYDETEGFFLRLLFPAGNR